MRPSLQFNFCNPYSITPQPQHNIRNVRYKGVEQDMIVKIQVPWTEDGHPEVNRELWVYDKTRNFTVCILPRDPNCGVIRNKILSEGLPCIRPGRKLYFKARLSREFLLKIELDKTVLAYW